MPGGGWQIPALPGFTSLFALWLHLASPDGLYHRGAWAFDNSLQDVQLSA